VVREPARRVGWRHHIASSGEFVGFNGALPRAALSRKRMSRSSFNTLASLLIGPLAPKKRARMVGDLLSACKPD
jgi:hypothetical protein